MIRDCLSVLKFDLENEFKSLVSILSLALYIGTVIYLIYFLLNSSGAATNIEVKYWNSIFWIVVLFSVINILISHFSKYSENQRNYFYTIYSPQGFIMGKILFFLIYSILMSLIAYGIFTLWIGNPVLNFGRFIISIVLGASAFSTLLTMTTSISIFTKNQSLISALLGFPLAIPLISITANLCRESFSMSSSDNFVNNVLILTGYNLLLIALSIFLYPFIWRR